MAFTYDFSAPDNTTLGNVPGFTRLIGGADEANIRGGVLGRDAIQGGPLFYATADNGAAVQSVKAERVYRSQVGLVVFGSVGPTGKLSGYYLRINHSETTCRLEKISDGVLTTLVGTSQSIIGSSIKLTASLNSAGNPVLKGWSGDAEILTYTDDKGTGGAPFTSGRRGIYFINPSTVPYMLDNYEDNSDATAGTDTPTGPTTIGFALDTTGIDLGDAMFFEGKRLGGGAPLIEGSYTGAPSAIEARFVDESSNVLPGFDWTEVVAEPSGGQFDFLVSAHFPALLPVGIHAIELRDPAQPTSAWQAPREIWVGTAVPLLGQSQCSLMRTQDKGGAAIDPEAARLVRVVAAVDENGSYSQAVASYKIDNNMGSAFIEAANEWAQISNGQTEPLVIIDLNKGGRSIQDWLNDRSTDSSSTPDPTAWNLYSGFATAIFGAVNGQLTEIMTDWGTDLIPREASTPGAYAADIEELMVRFGTDFLGFRPHCAIFPHRRSCDDGNENGSNWRLRNAQYQLATSGDPNFSLAGWLLDVQMDNDGSPHQSDLGNRRAGRVLGRSLGARHLGGTVSAFGPAIVKAEFAGNIITSTYDKDVKTEDGRATPELFYVSADNWADTSNMSYEQRPDYFMPRFNDNPKQVELVKTTGDWTGNEKVDWCRSTPWDTTDGRYGGEANIVENKLNGLLRGVGTFDGGRGLIAQPVMGAGMAVTAATTTAPPTTDVPRSTVVTLTYAEVMTLAVKGGQFADANGEPIALRAVRVDDNGNEVDGGPVDGINITFPAV